jgi:CBS domain containing-hemolysin-like protein
VIRVIQGMSNVLVRALGVEPRDELSMAKTADELAALVAESHQEGVIEDFAHDLLSGALDFGGRLATSVMVTRADVVAVPRTATVREVEQVVVDTGVSRLPVVGRDLDDVLGFVHSKDLLAVPSAGRDRVVPLSMIRRVLVVAPDRTLANVLASMRRSRVHLAVVRDADGRTLGLVTLEDLLEELVGDIVDETDVRPNVRE